MTVTSRPGRLTTVSWAVAVFVVLVFAASATGCGAGRRGRRSSGWPTRSP
jgi:hypothetical protein